MGHIAHATVRPWSSPPLDCGNCTSKCTTTSQGVFDYEAGLCNTTSAPGVVYQGCLESCANSTCNGHSYAKHGGCTMGACTPDHCGNPCVQRCCGSCHCHGSRFLRQLHGASDQQGLAGVHAWLHAQLPGILRLRHQRLRVNVWTASFGASSIYVCCVFSRLTKWG